MSKVIQPDGTIVIIEDRFLWSAIENCISESGREFNEKLALNIYNNLNGQMWSYGKIDHMIASGRYE